MTIKSIFCLVISLFLTGVIAFAQHPTPPVPPEAPVVALVQHPTAPAPPEAPALAIAQQAAPAPPAPVEPFGHEFSFFIDGGGFLGVYAEDISRENMAHYGLREPRGVGITNVAKDSPAEKAGLRKDDVIVRFDGENITSVRKLNRLVSEVAPDQSVRIGISRAGSEQEVAVTMGKRDYSDAMRVFRGMPGEKFRIEGLEGLKELEKFKGWKGMGKDDNFVFAFGNSRRIGVSTTTLTKQLAEYFGVTEGVLVSSVTEDGPAAKAGIKAGDVITAVDGEKIEDSGDLARALNKKKEGDVTLTIVRNKAQRSITVTPKEGASTLIQPGTVSKNGRTVVIPRIEIPAIPEVNIRVPSIQIPVIPEINVNIKRPLKGDVTTTVVRQPI